MNSSFYFHNFEKFYKSAREGFPIFHDQEGDVHILTTATVTEFATQDGLNAIKNASPAHDYKNVSHVKLALVEFQRPGAVQSVPEATRTTRSFLAA